MGYFKPLRRKIGVVALVLACVSLVGWVRSLTYLDQFMAPFGESWGALAVSRDGTFTCVLWNVPGNLPIFDWQVAKLNQMRSFDPVHVYDSLTAFGNKPPKSVCFGPFTYWSIVIPLMLLSAWLLLSKPRKMASVPTK